MKQKLAYIDHSFHKKTKSTYFLRDILRDHFDIVDIWDESWNGGEKISATQINSQNFDYVLFFQSFLPLCELKKIKAKIIWVPMYDGVVQLGNSFWMELSTISIKILSFSKKISEITANHKLDTLSVQYFINPEDLPMVVDYAKKKVFFWQRTNFSFSDVKKIIGNQEINQFILKLDPDPGYKASFPIKEDIEKYNIKIIQETLSKEEYTSLLKESNLFISPRKYEGIGMSFIEAMTMGLSVVAIDKPTMNEYIRNDKNGYLVDPNKLREIDFSTFKKNGINAREGCLIGYEKWKNSHGEIINFMHSQFANPTKINQTVLLFVKLRDLIVKVKLKLEDYF